MFETEIKKNEKQGFFEVAVKGVIATSGCLVILGYLAFWGGCIYLVGKYAFGWW